MEEDDIHLSAAAASKPICFDTVKSSKNTTDGISSCPNSSQPHIGGFSLCSHKFRNGFTYNNYPNTNNNHNKYEI